METALQGNLNSFRISDLLTFINLCAKSGTLHLVCRARETSVFFDTGHVVYAASNQRAFRLSSILLRRKKITTSQWRKVERSMALSEEKFGQLAVEEGILTREELHDFLKIQVSEMVYDCFDWDQGDFTFTEGLRLPDYAVTISIELLNLIMEGARRIDEWGHCKQLLPNKHAIFRVLEDPGSQVRISLSLDEWKILFLVNGKRTLDEVCEAAVEGPLFVYKVIYGLLAGQLIECCPEAGSEVAEVGPGGRQAHAVSAEAHQQDRHDDTNLLVSEAAHLSYAEIMKIPVPQLTVKLPGEPSICLTLEQDEYVIGRSRDNQVRIDDRGVSKVHAKLTRATGGYVLDDLDSRNGTFVNGERVGRRVLQDGDCVRIGNADMLFSITYEVKPVAAGN